MLFPLRSLDWGGGSSLSLMDNVYLLILSAQYLHRWRLGSIIWCQITAAIDREPRLVGAAPLELRTFRHIHMGLVCELSSLLLLPLPSDHQSPGRVPIIICMRHWKFLDKITPTHRQDIWCRHIYIIGWFIAMLLPLTPASIPFTRLTYINSSEEMPMCRLLLQNIANINLRI